MGSGVEGGITSPCLMSPYIKLVCCLKNIQNHFEDSFLLRARPLESSGQAGSRVFLIFLLKNQVFLLFKLNLNIALHPVKTKRGHPLESSGQAGCRVFLIFFTQKPSVLII